MRKMSTTARDELVNALARRYAVGARAEKTRILDEFEAVTGFHRKHAIARPALQRDPATCRRESRPAHLRRRSPRGAGGALGGVGPDLRQTPEGVDADAGGCDGAARPPEARAGDPRRAAGHERSNHGQVAAQDAGAGRRQTPPADCAAVVGAPEHPGAHVLGLGTTRRRASPRPIWSRTAAR